MITRFCKLCLGLFATQALLSACATPFMSGPERFATYYGDKAESAAFDDYNLLVLDSEHHPELGALSRGRVLMGYVSLSELKPHQSGLVDASLVLETNQAWNSQIVDIRKPEWTAKLIDELIPQTLDKGFDGLMLDTVDSALHLEAREPETYSGMKDAAVTLIQTIRLRFPHAKLMLNRGFEIHQEVGASIDMILAESILSHYDLQTKQAAFFPDDVYAHYVKKLHHIQTQFPHLRVYSIDYWDITDQNTVVDIYRIQRAKGFIPYVSTPDLTTIYPEPPASRSRLSNRKDSAKEEI